MSTEPFTEDQKQEWQLNELMREPAYRDPSNPRHERVKAVVTKYFEQKHEGEISNRRPSPIVIDTTPLKQK